MYIGSLLLISFSTVVLSVASNSIITDRIDQLNIIISQQKRKIMELSMFLESNSSKERLASLVEENRQLLSKNVELEKKVARLEEQVGLISFAGRDKEIDELSRELRSRVAIIVRLMQKYPCVAEELKKINEEENPEKLQEIRKTKASAEYYWAEHSAKLFFRDSGGGSLS